MTVEPCGRAFPDPRSAFISPLCSLIILFFHLLKLFDDLSWFSLIILFFHLLKLFDDLYLAIFSGSNPLQWNHACPVISKFTEMLRFVRSVRLNQDPGTQKSQEKRNKDPLHPQFWHYPSYNLLLNVLFLVFLKCP